MMTMFNIAHNSEVVKRGCFPVSQHPEVNESIAPKVCGFDGRPDIPFDHAYRVLASRAKHVRLASRTKGCAPNAPTFECSSEVSYAQVEFLSLRRVWLELGSLAN
jgi:hypothetical protein